VESVRVDIGLGELVLAHLGDAQYEVELTEGLAHLPNVVW
jgi:hypothetical protein